MTFRPHQIVWSCHSGFSFSRILSSSGTKKASWMSAISTELMQLHFWAFWSFSCAIQPITNAQKITLFVSCGLVNVTNLLLRKIKSLGRAIRFHYKCIAAARRRGPFGASRHIKVSVRPPRFSYEGLSHISHWLPYLVSRNELDLVNNDVHYLKLLYTQSERSPLSCNNIELECQRPKYPFNFRLVPRDDRVEILSHGFEVS